MAQATDSPIPNPTLPTRPLPLACCVGTGFVPVIYHSTRVAEYLRHERLIRKAKTSADEALAYAARVIWHRQRRAADKRRKLEALSHPRYFSYFLDAAK
jgi:hypothetical protein